MDAIKYITENQRMCNYYLDYHDDCIHCLLRKYCVGNGCVEEKNAGKAVEIVEQFSKEHPVKTRADVFLEMFPNTETRDNGFPNIEACTIEGYRQCKNCEWHTGHCHETYWNAPAPEGFGKLKK